ncbi:hypothetical protein [Arenimonas sp.]|uniref:hypothetical protein n=1 Tax=Arenimonas sp. TaxID=1872635 RepID=UPI0039E2E43F
MKFRVIACMALLCVSSTVSAKKYVLPAPVAQELPVEVTLSQQEIAIDTPDNSAVAGQFGLIGALVGAAISNSQAKTAEERAGQIRNLLIDYRFNEDFERAIRAKIASDGISPSPQLVLRDTVWDAYSANTQAGLKQSEAAGKEPPTGTLMAITPRYALSYTLQEMYVSAFVSILQRTKKPNGKYKDKWMWSRSYRFTIPLNPSYGLKPETNIGRWQAIGGPEMQRMLKIGVEQVTDMIVYDFSAEGRAEAERKVDKKEAGEFKGNKTFGRQVRTSDEWYWLRAGKGYMMTLSGRMPLELDGPATAKPAASVGAEASATAMPSGDAATAPANPAAVSADATVEHASAGTDVDAAPANEAAATPTPADADGQ